MQREGRAWALVDVLSRRAGVAVPLLHGVPQAWPSGTSTAVTVLETTDLTAAAEMLRAAGHHVDLLGRVGGGDERAMAVLLHEPPFPAPVPDDFRVLAIIPAYNEADVVVGTVSGLLAQGVEVHVLDNWSTDGTPELLADLPGRLTVERFPSATAPVRYEWAAILDRVRHVARDSGADWCVLHDADERRSGPWPGRGLRESFHEVSRRGYNAVDHTVWEFHPVDDSFRAGDDLESVLRHWSPAVVGANRTQVKAWNHRSELVDLVSSGGHEAAFPGRRTFPMHFLLKHYPIRSQAHGEQKVLVDRKPRFLAEERRRLWHRHYDHVRAGHNFVWSTAGLVEDEAGTADALLLERLTGADPEVVAHVKGLVPQPAVRFAQAIGLRPTVVTVRRAYRIVRRRNPETGRR